MYIYYVCIGIQISIHVEAWLKIWGKVRGDVSRSDAKNTILPEAQAQFCPSLLYRMFEGADTGMCACMQNAQVCSDPLRTPRSILAQAAPRGHAAVEAGLGTEINSTTNTVKGSGVRV